MQSDTVIGIVGAIVLVSVMVGIFAYEYNNVEEDDTPSAAEMDAQNLTSFNETFASAGINPYGDLDGDGVLNYNETDLDGDGINNTDDPIFEFTMEHDASGHVAAPAPPAQSTGYSLSFDAEAGLSRVMLILSHDERVTGDQNLAPLDVRLNHAGGNPTVTPNVSGGTVTYVLDLTDVAPGTYTLDVQPFSAGGVLSLDPGTDVTGQLFFHYGPINVDLEA